MIESGLLFRAATVSALVALVGFIVAAVAIGLFFGGAGQIYGPINDVAISITMLALLLPILAVDRAVGEQVGLWLRIVTVAALAGAVLVAGGQLALVVGIIDLETSFVTGGLGFLPVVIWIIALAALAAMGVVPTSVGWPAAASIGLIVVASVVTMVTTGLPAWLAWGGVVIAMAIWLGALAAWLWSLVPSAVGQVVA